MKQSYHAAAGLACALVVLTSACAGANSEQPPRQGPPSLAAMDADGNGKVTVQEFDAAMARMGPGEGPGKGAGNVPPGPPPANGKAPGGPPPDGGKAGPGGKGAPPPGSSIDTSKDGIVSQQEFDAFLANMPKPPAK